MDMGQVEVPLAPLTERITRAALADVITASGEDLLTIYLAQVALVMEVSTDLWTKGGEDG